MSSRPSETSESRTRPRTNNTSAVINVLEVYTMDEVARRMRWKAHSIRQAKRLGLKTVRFGSRDYVLGRHVLEFFEKLAQMQAKDA